MKMRIDSKDFRVRAGEKVQLKQWPTRIKPCHKSKAHYKEILADVEERRQWKHYQKAYEACLSATSTAIAP
jgi:polyphosphate kinase 2 (PPK2 family)